jgi:SnoaL-like protein
MEEFVDRWAAFWNAPDPARVGELAAADIELRYPGLSEPLRGIEAWQEQVASIVRRFPDVRLAVTAYAMAGDLCFLSWRGTATAEGMQWLGKASTACACVTAWSSTPWSHSTPPAFDPRPDQRGVIGALVIQCVDDSPQRWVASSCPPQR